MNSSLPEEWRLPFLGVLLYKSREPSVGRVVDHTGFVNIVPRAFSERYLK